MTAVDHALHEIARAPLRWPKWKQAPQVRRFVLKRFPFVVAYTWDGTTATVIGVVHAQRNPAVWLSRLRRRRK